MEECEVCNDIGFHEIIDCIVSALDAKDPYTAGHSERVSDMAIVVCQLLEFTHEQTQAIHIAAHLHDIGKIVLENWEPELQALFCKDCLRFLLHSGGNSPLFRPCR